MLTLCWSIYSRSLNKCFPSAMYEIWELINLRWPNLHSFSGNFIVIIGGKFITYYGGNKYYYLSFGWSVYVVLRWQQKHLCSFPFIIFFCNLFFSWCKYIVIYCRKQIRNTSYVHRYKQTFPFLAVWCSMNVANENQVGYCFKRSFIAKIYQCKWKRCCVVSSKR